MTKFYDRITAKQRLSIPLYYIFIKKMHYLHSLFCEVPREIEKKKNTQFRKLLAEDKRTIRELKKMKARGEHL